MLSKSELANAEMLLEKTNGTCRRTWKRTAFPFWPTNEKPLTTILVARNEYLFCDHDMQKSPSARKHAALQSQFQPFLHQYFEWVVSNFLLQTILEMPISGSEGLNPFKRPIADILLEKKNETYRRTCKTNNICILTHKWEAANRFLIRS